MSNIKYRRNYINLYSKEDITNPTKFKITQGKITTRISTGGSFEFAENELSVTNIVSRLLAINSIENSVTLLNSKININEVSLNSLEISLNDRIESDENYLISLNNRITDTNITITNFHYSMSSIITSLNTNIIDIENSLNNNILINKSSIDKINNALIVVTNGKYDGDLNNLDNITSYFLSNSGTTDLIALNSRFDSLKTSFFILEKEFSLLTAG